MAAFHHIEINNCHFWSRPKMVAEGVAKFTNAAQQAGRELPPPGYMTKEVMQSQAIYLSNFIVPPYRCNTMREACGRAIVDLNSLDRG